MSKPKAKPATALHVVQTLAASGAEWGGVWVGARSTEARAREVAREASEKGEARVTDREGAVLAHFRNGVLVVLVVLGMLGCSPAQLASVAAAVPVAVKITCGTARLVVRGCELVEPSSGDESAP